MLWVYLFCLCNAIGMDLTVVTKREFPGFISLELVKVYRSMEHPI